MLKDRTVPVVILCQIVASVIWMMLMYAYHWYLPIIFLTIFQLVVTVVFFWLSQKLK